MSATTFKPRPTTVGALTIRRRPREALWERCHCGCLDDRSNSTRGAGFKGASKVATILDHETPLCASCAREWAAAWEGAVGPF